MATATVELHRRVKGDCRWNITKVAKRGNQIVEREWANERLAYAHRPSIRKGIARLTIGMRASKLNSAKQQKIPNNFSLR